MRFLGAQGATAADKPKIRSGETVAGQAGTYRQSFEMFGWDSQSALRDFEAGTCIFDQIDYELQMFDCRADSIYLGFSDASWPQNYWGAVAWNCVFPSVSITIYASMVNQLWIGMSSVGATAAYIYGEVWGDYNFDLYLSDNAIPAGTDADDGYSGTICGVINHCYNNFYLNGATGSALYLTGENMGQLEAGMHDSTIANADEMALAGWLVDYEIYIEEMP